MIIEAGLTRYEAVNKEIEKQLEKQNKVTVKDVNGQRYIGCALDEGKTIEVYGTPGNDMACYLNGGRVVVYGSSSGCSRQYNGRRRNCCPRSLR